MIITDARSQFSLITFIVNSHIHKKHSVTLHSTEIMYDPKSPKFGASVRDHTNMLTVDWATEDSGLMKGDL